MSANIRIAENALECKLRFIKEITGEPRQSTLTLKRASLFVIFLHEEFYRRTQACTSDTYLKSNILWYGLLVYVVAF